MNGYSLVLKRDEAIVEFETLMARFCLDIMRVHMLTDSIVVSTKEIGDGVISVIRADTKTGRALIEAVADANESLTACQRSARAREDYDRALTEKIRKIHALKFEVEDLKLRLRAKDEYGILREGPVGAGEVSRAIS